MKRGHLESDPSHKQPIGYSMIINPELKKVFAYKRSEKGGEGRLHNKWSWGVGGHIEKSDFATKTDNPIYTSLEREVLIEEVRMNGKVNRIFPIGYINDETGVNAVHFGILYIIETDSSEVRPNDPEIKEGRLVSLEELEKICSAPGAIIEDWSKIALEPLKRYLEK